MHLIQLGCNRMTVEVMCKIGTWFTWKIYHWTPSWFFKKMQRDPFCLYTSSITWHLVNSFVLVCFALLYLLFCFVFVLFWERTYNKEWATTLILKALSSYGAKWKAHIISFLQFGPKRKKMDGLHPWLMTMMTQDLARFYQYS